MYTIIHAILGYFFLLFIVRVLSRRPGAQLTPFEFVIIFLIGGVIILATVGDDKSITNCVCAIITIGLMHLSVAGLRFRSPRISQIIDGVPLVLLKDGEWQLDAMHGMRIDDNDVMAAARVKGVSNLEGIQYAILERNGAISIIKKTGPKESAST
jgi:uncharacterized membrane protein YcaP (DUF421 family)